MAAARLCFLQAENSCHNDANCRLLARRGLNFATKALALKADSCEGLLIKGALLMKLDKFSEAAETFQSVRKTFNEFAAYEGLVKVYLTQTPILAMMIFKSKKLSYGLI